MTTSSGISTFEHFPTTLIWFENWRNNKRAMKFFPSLNEDWTDNVKIPWPSRSKGLSVLASIFCVLYPCLIPSAPIVNFSIYSPTGGITVKFLAFFLSNLFVYLFIYFCLREIAILYAGNFLRVHWKSREKKS